MSGAPSVRPEQRFNASRPCLICGGHGSKPRGIGERCMGFLSEDGKWAHCSREEFAGQAPYNDKTGAYVHKLTGDCKCGARHGFPTSGPPPSGEHNGHAWREKRGQIVKTYDYPNERRQLLYQTVRYADPKGFAQRRPKPGGGWIWNLEGVRRVLYRLPELLDADPAETVLYPEGEKDSDRAAAEGFVSTTNARGAKEFRPEYADMLRGRHVAIFGDNDKDGREGAEKKARGLYGKAASVKVIELSGLEEKGDLSDWFDQGGTVDKLRQMISEAPEWTPPEERDDGRVLLGRVLREGIEPPAVLVHDLLLDGKTHAIYGPSGYGKTYVELWLALEVIKRGTPVLLFDNENNVSIMAERLEQLGADPDQLDRLLHYHPFPELPTTDEGRQLFEAKLDRIKPALVCFDSWISFLASNGLDENSSNDIAEFSTHYLQPARRRGVATLLIDHVPHEGNHARGSTRKRDEVDVMWSLSRLNTFDRDRVGSIVLNRIKDREGWLPTSVTFSVGGTGDGGFVFSRSAGTVEVEDEEGLKESERKALEALETFEEKGAIATEWQKKALALEVARRTFYRAKDELLRKERVFVKGKRFFIKGVTGAKKVPRHQMAPASEEVPQVPPPFRVAPDGTTGTDDEGMYF